MASSRSVRLRRKPSARAVSRNGNPSLRVASTAAATRSVASPMSNRGLSLRLPGVASSLVAIRPPVDRRVGRPVPLKHRTGWFVKAGSEGGGSGQSPGASGASLIEHEIADLNYVSSRVSRWGHHRNEFDQRSREVPVRKEDGSARMLLR